VDFSWGKINVTPTSWEQCSARWCRYWFFWCIHCSSGYMAQW